MVTAAQFRKLAMTFPEVEEKSHFEQPDFRVRNKIFAGLSRDSAEGTLKLTPELQAMVLSAEPDVFVPAAGAWGRSGWTRIVLKKAELPGLRELLAESYRLVAPKGLLKSRSSLLDEAPSPKTVRPNPARKKVSAAKRSSKRKRPVRARACASTQKDQ